MKTNPIELSKFLNRLSQSGFSTETRLSEIFNQTFIQAYKNGVLYQEGYFDFMRQWFREYQTNGMPQIGGQNSFPEYAFGFDEPPHPLPICDGDWSHGHLEHFGQPPAHFNCRCEVVTIETPPYRRNAVMTLSMGIVILLLAVIIFNTPATIFAAGLPGALFVLNGFVNAFRHFKWSRSLNLSQSVREESSKMKIR